VLFVVVLIVFPGGLLSVRLGRRKAR
jgi:hypothetical protein